MEKLLFEAILRRIYKELDSLSGISQSNPTPILYQYVTDLIFRELIHSHFVGSVCDNTPPTVLLVTHHEGNALRYAGGYVCRHLRKK